MTAPLDNPVWRALTGPHAELALGRGQARLEGRSDGIPVGRNGKPMRAAVGGSKTLIASSVKVAPPGASIDIPIGHKDEAWSFAHFNTITVSIADSPRPHKILLAIVAADGGRPDNRCGTEPIR